MRVNTRNSNERRLHMPRVAPGYILKYRYHRRSGQARVEIDGKTFYLGPWKSTASYAEYDRLIIQWLANCRRA